MNENLIHQAILARDIIDMARDNATNPDVLEYINSFCWELFMIFREQSQNVIGWNVLSGIYEQQYTALRRGDSTQQSSELDDIYTKVSDIIKSGYKD